MNNYPYQPYYPAAEPIVRHTKGHVMFFFTTWIIPLIFMIPPIIFYGKLSQYSPLEIEWAKYSSSTEAGEIKLYQTLAVIFLVFFIILLVSGIIDCINTAMKSLTLTPTQISGRNGLSNCKRDGKADFSC